MINYNADEDVDLRFDLSDGRPRLVTVLLVVLVIALLASVAVLFFV
jgi:hypothetical protein